MHQMINMKPWHTYYNKYFVYTALNVSRWSWIANSDYESLHVVVEFSRILDRNVPIRRDFSWLLDVSDRMIMNLDVWFLSHFSLNTVFSIETHFRSNQVFRFFLDVSDICEVDEVVMDMAIADDVFQFLRSAVIATDNFHKEEFYLRRVHTLVTDFLVYMPLKVRTLTSSFTCLSRLEHWLPRLHASQG